MTRPHTTGGALRPEETSASVARTVQRLQCIDRLTAFREIHLMKVRAETPAALNRAFAVMRAFERSVTGGAAP